MKTFFKIKYSLTQTGLALALALGACGATPVSSPPGPTVAPAPATAPVVISGPGAGSRPAVVDQPAPDFSWNENNQTTSLTALKGHPLILNWWASWCEPCRTEMPLLTATARSQPNRERGLVVIGINLKESESEVNEFYGRYTPGFKLLRDQDARLSAAYTLRGLPQTVFINPQGVIKAIVRGPLTPQSLEENIRLALEA